MPSLANVLLCALSALGLSLCLGLPGALLIAGDKGFALAYAPALGWAILSVLALLLLSWIGFSPTAVALVCAAAAAGGLALLLRSGARKTVAETGGPRIPPWNYGAAMLLALVPALGAWPKLSSGGAFLGESMFDHAKIAIIDDIIRLGLPPGNPFFGAVGDAPGLAYYYLWHFGAAMVGALLGASGWEADIALTWFTAFASLMLMMAFAVRLSGQRSAALWVVLLSCGASLRPVLSFLSPAFEAEYLSQYPAPKSWLFQATWAPQHLAAANCTLLAIFLLSRLAAPRAWPLVPLLAALVAAGFESSTWVGGIVFGTGAAATGLALLLVAENATERADLLAKSGIAVILVAAIAQPFLRDQYAALAARDLGMPIAVKPFEVLGPVVPDPLRRLFDLPAFWLILLAVELPAIYVAGIAPLAAALARSSAAPERRFVIACALLAAASFVVAWLFVSVIANNDLGWRSVLPGILVLTIFAAAGLARWLARGRILAAAAALAGLILAIPGGAALLRENALGFPATSATALAEAPELWAAVRRHATPDERVGNNPLFTADSVRWPINISWAIFANRSSCFAAWNLARPFVALPRAEIDRINTVFERVFAGTAEPLDVKDLAWRYDCRVVVVSAEDGAWTQDPFAASGDYRLVEEAARWRIYRRRDRP